ncbi:hypothetical protein KR067_001951 [Drosophila pandora]|nr:hypothetical protein KR067_001951 [Drosophila pandora]
MHHTGCLALLLLLGVSGMAFDLRAPSVHHVRSSDVSHPESLRGALERFGLKQESTDLILEALEKFKALSLQPDLIEKRAKAIDGMFLELVGALQKVEDSGPMKRCKGHRPRGTRSRKPHAKASN